METPEINPCLYGQLMFNKGGMSIQWSENSLFNKWCWENWTGICKKKERKKRKQDHHLIPYTRIISKWMKNLNTSHDTIKVLAENIGSKILDIPIFW